MLSLTESDIFTVLGDYLASILPFGAAGVARGLDNKTPELQCPDFVIMWPLRMPRLATNADSYIDCKFLASLDNGVMVVTDVERGSIVDKSLLLGLNLSAPTTVLRQSSGPAGGVGTYLVSGTQVLASQTLGTGIQSVTQETEIVIQVDVQGPNSQDNAQIISTLLNDDNAFQFFQAANPAIAPLWADDEPKQIPFENENQQIEQRFVIEVHLQANITVSPMPQDFADALTVNTIPVDVLYH